MNSFENFGLPNYFRIDQLISEFNFLKDYKDFDESKRFKLIELRSKEEPEFRNYKMIPANDRLIRKDVFEAYEKRKLLENKLTETKDENEIEAFRLKGRRLTQKIREQILKKFRYAQHQKSLSDIVVEETIPNLT